MVAKTFSGTALRDGKPPQGEVFWDTFNILILSNFDSFPEIDFSPLSCIKKFLFAKKVLTSFCRLYFYNVENCMPELKLN